MECANVGKKATVSIQGQMNRLCQLPPLTPLSAPPTPRGEGIPLPHDFLLGRIFFFSRRAARVLAEVRLPSGAQIVTATSWPTSNHRDGEGSDIMLPGLAQGCDGTIMDVALHV